MFLFSLIDYGEFQNAKYRRSLYKSGQIMQAHFLLLGEHVWIERDISCGEFWRVAFGPKPNCPNLMTFDELREKITEHFFTLSEVIA